LGQTTVGYLSSISICQSVAAIAAVAKQNFLLCHPVILSSPPPFQPSANITDRPLSPAATRLGLLAAMAPSSKNAAAAKDRRKSNNTAAAATTANAAARATSPKTSLIVTLKVTPEKLRAIIDPDFVKEDSPAKQSTTAAPNSNAENASDSTPNSPSAGTPAAQSASMGPPTEGPKKKGVKRSAGAAAIGNGEPKARGKPGPKKKQRL
jgi:hypothetical protein